MTPASPERVIAVVPEHWVRYVRLVSVIVLVGLGDLALFLLAGVFAIHNAALSNGLFMAAVLLLLLLHHWSFAALGSETVRSIIITNRRVVHYGVRLLFYEELKEIAFEKMKSVDAVMKGFWQNLLRYGSLEFEEKTVVHDVPHPTRVVRIIEQAQGLR